MTRVVTTGGKRLKAALRKARHAVGVNRLEVGFFSDSKYPDGTQVAAVAAWNEFGTKRIPERPFFRQALSTSESVVAHFIKQEVDPLDLKVKATMAGQLGALIVGEIQRRIIDLDSPPNAPFTKLKKGSSNPLIDTGQMLGSVTWKAR